MLYLRCDTRSGSRLGNSGRISLSYTLDGKPVPDHGSEISLVTRQLITTEKMYSDIFQTFCETIPLTLSTYFPYLQAKC